MIDASTPEWKDALRLVRLAFESPGDAAARDAAAAFLAAAEEPRLRRLARLLGPSATVRDLQSALVPLERVDRRAKITDADMGITTTDRETPRRLPAGRLVAVADNLRSAFNVGGLFRTADFFGIDKLYLCGYTATPDHPQVARAALGAQDSVAWEHADDLRDVTARLKKEGCTIYALETGARARPLDASFCPAWPAALLLGNERFGLDPDVVAAADEILEIPAFGLKNSLNVVSAFSIAAAFFRSPSR